MEHLVRKSEVRSARVITFLPPYVWLLHQDLRDNRMDDDLVHRTITALAERSRLTAQNAAGEELEAEVATSNGGDDLEKVHRKQRGQIQQALRKSKRRGSHLLGSADGMTLRGNLDRVADALSTSLTSRSCLVVVVRP